MARPNLTRTWGFSTNRAVATKVDINTTNGHALFEIKEGLVACGLTVTRSCVKTGTSTGNVSDSDLWLSGSDILHGTRTASKSWTLIRSLAGWELMLAKQGQYTGAGYAYVTLSPSGTFSAGDAINVPTAADQIILNPDNVYFFIYNTSDAARVIHVIASDNQDSIIVLHMGQSIVRSFIMIQNITDTTLLESNMIAVGTNISPTYSGFVRGDGLRARVAGVEYPVRLTTKSVSAFGLAEIWNTPDPLGNLPFTKVRAILPTPGAQAVLGEIRDLWYCPSAGVVTGDTVASDTTSSQFAVFGSMLFPWDGSVPLIA